MASENDATQKAKEGRAPAPELRLLDRRAFVGFPPLELAPGLIVSDFGLQIPDVTFPFNVSGGASRFQRKRLQFGFLELTIATEVITRRIGEVADRLGELQELKLHLRAGCIEGQARLVAGERIPFTFKISLDGEGERLSVIVYDVRLYGFSPVASVQVPVLLARAMEASGILPNVEARGATGFTTKLLAQLVQRAAVGRGFKMPQLDEARLSNFEVSGTGLKLRFAAGGLPPPAQPDEELLLTLEGSRAFADAEALIAQGKLAEARETYLRLGDAAGNDAHPFAAERLLSLLVADPQGHELALDVAALLLRRRERSPAALWAEAVVRERRGESARAAERFLALCALSRKSSEEAAAFFAAEAAARAGRDSAPQMAVKALHELLGLKPDHLPSLKALARASDQARDRAGAIRAYRRISALARDSAEAAEAHVHLARLCAETEDDIAGARLHCEAALRLSPDHPEALLRLGDLCFRAGEHARALRAADRLRDVALGRHELDRVGRAHLLAGRVYEVGLQQLDNALLRYRESISLLPTEAEAHYFVGRTAEKLGRLQEALAGYQQALELAGPQPRTESIREAAHAANHALARLYRTRLSDPARARQHFELALALDPNDLTALDELLPYFRANGRVVELADACERAGPAIDDPIRRAALFAEAGEICRTRLDQPDRAERLLTAALDADPRHRIALEGMLALAEARRDGGMLCRCLKALAELTTEAAERVRLWRRLAVAARDLAFDLDLAVSALHQVLAVEPADLPALGELCALQRRRTDMEGLVRALDRRAQAAEAVGDKRLASASLRELAQVLEGRLGRVGEALVALEKAARLSTDAGVLLDLADLSLRSERPEHARRALEELLATLPKQAAPERLADVRVRLGQACEQLGDRDSAREHYEQAFPLRRLDDALADRLEALYRDAGMERSLAELWAGRAQALVAAGRPEAAQPLFLQSARTLLTLKESSAALLRLNSALDCAPEGHQAAATLETMAQLELERGEPLEAARLLARKATLVDDAHAAAGLLFRASGLASGSPREAGYLADALGRQPRHAPARIRRAELLVAEDPAAALDDLEVALTLDSSVPDAPDAELRTVLQRRAATAAQRAGRTEVARRYLGLYAARHPEDLDAQLELAALHRTSGARDSLCDLLEALWPRLPAAEAKAMRREYIELALALGRTGGAAEGLRSLRAEAPSDAWAARTLLSLLPAPGSATSAQESERLELLSALIAQSDEEARVELLVQRAALHKSAGRVAAAREDLTAAARLAPSPAPLLVQLAELLAAEKNAAAELEVWREAVAADPGLAAIAGKRLLALSQLLLERGELGSAQTGFAAAASLASSGEAKSEAGFGLAAAALAAGNLEAAAEAFLQASRVGPSVRRVEALIERATLLEQLGRREDAAESLDAALRLAPRQERATRERLRLLRALEQWEPLAELLALEAAHAAPSGAGALWSELGSIQADRLGDSAAAESSFRRASASITGPDAVALRERLAELVLQRGDKAEAAKLLDEASTFAGQSEAAPLLRRAARLLHEAGESPRALELARRAQELAAAEAGDLELLADLLFTHGSPAEALALHASLARAARFDETPERYEQLWLRVATLAEATCDLSTAEDALRRVLTHCADHAEAANRLSTLLAASNPRESVEVLWRYAQQVQAAELALPLLERLSQRAQEELADLPLAAEMLGRAASLAAEPLALRLRRASLFREGSRTAELIEELPRIADAADAAGEISTAIDALGEQALLTESAGRIDETLRTLQRLQNACAGAERAGSAAECALRRARLFEEAKLELDSASQALEEAHALHPSLDAARAGVRLAQRREDASNEALWLERLVKLLPEAAQRAEAHLALAILFQGALAAPQEAEAAARAALAESPRLAAAETLLSTLLTHEGRIADLAAYFEEASATEASPGEKVALLRRAATLYKDHANRPESAAAALLAARAALPDDLLLTAEAADLLHAVGRPDDAADFDAVLLEQDPLRPHVFERHAAHLERTGEHVALAQLLLRRADAQAPTLAAETFLLAADAFRRAGAEERALLCERQAFELAPEHDRAFALQRERSGTEPRRLAELLARRAAVLPDPSAIPLLRERAEVLQRTGETVLAADAWEALLARAADESGDFLDALIARADLAAASGGPRAAQPFDRRLVSLAPDRVPVPLRARVQLRMGHASVAAGAWHDAADAFGEVLALEPEGPRAAEALSLLAEAQSQTQDRQGLYGTTLKLARATRDPAEVEALLRRAADLIDEPAEALDALLPLVALRPSDEALLDRAVRGLQAAGRAVELLSLYERGAEAAGGERAAELLLAAAATAEDTLGDADRAIALIRRAGEAAPDSESALRALLEGQKKRGELEGALETLARLVSLSQRRDQTEAAAAWQAERGELALSTGREEIARECFEAIVAQGPSTAGFAQSLAALEPLLISSGDEARLSQVLSLRAELVLGSARAELLMRAAEASARADDAKAALGFARESLAIAPSLEGFKALARHAHAAQDARGEAQALLEAAQLTTGTERGTLLLSSAEASVRAGSSVAARDLFVRAHAEAPDVLPVLALVERLESIGEDGAALEHGFTALCEAGQPERALALADRVGDKARARQVLLQLVHQPTRSVAQVDRLAREARAEGDAETLLLLADAIAENTPALAIPLIEELALSTVASIGIRIDALELRAAAGAEAPADFAAFLLALASTLSDASDPGLTDAVLGAIRALPTGTRAAPLRTAISALQSKSASLLRELYEQLRSEMNPAAAEVLSELAELETEPAAKAALLIELGDLLLESGAPRSDAREAFRRALSADIASLTAVRQLLALLSLPEDAAELVELSERLVRLAGPEANASLRGPLADALELVGRKREALELLGELEPTRERLERRARLAQEAGLMGESLRLREQLTEDFTELADILRGYVDAQLLPFAVKLASRLLGQGLPNETLRYLAERLGPTRDGAALAATLWPSLLEHDVTSADDWTLYAESLRLSGMAELGERLDGFGAALTDSTAAGPAPKLSRSSHARPDEALLADLPNGAVGITPQSMPRLYASLSPMLQALSAEPLQLALDVEGGVEAWLARGNTVVIGAGALAAFGPQELAYLVALALALGEHGARLRQPGEVEAFEAAAVLAFSSVRSPLAASRVLAHLDPSVRGTDPRGVHVAAILRQSRAFRAVALSALNMAE